MGGTVTRRNLEQALKEADKALETFGLPEDVDRRVSRRLLDNQARASAARRPRWWALAMAPIAVVAALVFFMRPGSSAPKPPPTAEVAPRRPFALADFRVLEASLDLEAKTTSGVVDVRKG